MEAFIALDVAIGLVFLYLLLSIICTAINEWIAGLFRLRARNLKTAISRLVDDPAAKSPGEVTGTRLSAQILSHPLIESLKDGKRGPSYIPAPRFVAVLKDIVKPTEAEAEAEGEAAEKVAVDAQERVRPKDLHHVTKQLRALNTTRPPRVRAAAAVGVAPVPADAAMDDEARVEEWFNQAMERASGWYRRRMMWITICVALAVVIASNADTIATAKILWHNPTVRAAVIKQADQRLTRPRPESNGLFVQADYPDKDKPVADTSTQGTGETAEADNVAEDESETADADTGLTEEERAALGQMIGWSRDFKRINKDVCLIRQKRINEACKPDVAATAECTKAVDEGPAGGVCVHGPNGLEPTDAFPPGKSVLSLAGLHLMGWLLTAIAVSMGAPFWFDTLKLFMSVRSSGKSPDEKK
jgi:hypothetical protein